MGRKLQNQLKIITTLFAMVCLSIGAHAQGSCTLTGSTLVCAESTVNYTGNFAGGVTHEWNAFGGTVIGSGPSVSVSWQNSLSGQVTLIIRDAFNQVLCTQLLNVSIAPKPSPVITSDQSVLCGRPGRKDDRERHDPPCIVACDSTWITYSTPFTPGHSYGWAITGNAIFIPSNTNTILVKWEGTGVGTISVSDTSALGCVGETSICVEIVGKPNAQFTTLPMPVSGVVTVCLNQDVVFQNQSTQGLGSPLSLYEWDFGDNSPLLIQQAPANPFVTHAYQSAGTYTASLIVKNECHCTDTFQVTIVVEPLPGQEIYCVGTVCPGSTATYFAGDTSCSSYSWSVTGGNISGSNNQSSVSVTWLGTSPGILTLNTAPCAGLCSAPSAIIVPVISPNAQIFGPTTVCYNDCQTYRISCDIPIDSIVWTLPSGVRVNNAPTTNKHEVALCFDSLQFVSGTIQVDYFHNLPGSTTGLSCGGQSFLQINAAPRLGLVSNPSEICDMGSLMVFSFSNPFVAPTGTTTWTATPASGGAPVQILTQGASLPLDISSWPNGPGFFYIEATPNSTQYCNSPQRTLIEVNPLPQPLDSITGISPVCPNRPYTYFAHKTNSDMSVQWVIENGTPLSNTGNMVSVLWGASGPYILKAVQIDPFTGCASDTLRDTIASILPLTISSNLGSNSACSNGSNTFSVSDPGDNFVWSISPSNAGSVIAGQNSSNITIEWHDYAGNATVTVTREACDNFINSSISVSVTAPPTPIISMPSSACQGSNVNFSVSGGGVSYAWDFGNNSSGSGQNIGHIYATPGNYVVTATVNYGGTCNASASSSASIMINPSPNITITSPNPLVYCQNVGNVTMFVSAPISGSNYNWYSIQSGFLSTGNSYTTNVIGNYFVTGSNSFGCIDTSNFITIDTSCVECVPEPGHFASFSSTATTCNTFSYSGSSSVGSSGPTWNFSDPFSGISTASGFTANHSFTEPGYYPVYFCVNVPDTSGLGSCKICSMRVDTVSYVPDFYDSLFCNSSGTGYGIRFINNTKRIAGLSAPSYAWQVMPGSLSSSSESPFFNLSPGTYSVTLTINSNCSVTRTIEIPSVPNASFVSTDSICVNAPVSFTMTVPLGSASLSWDFGDFSSSQNIGPTKAYSTPGNYTTSLTVTDAYGCFAIATGLLTVLPNTLAGVISPSDSSICEGDTIEYTVSASGGYPGYAYLWSNTFTTQNINASFTGHYYTNITDSKLCFHKTNGVNVMVNPVPKPEIRGPKAFCLNAGGFLQVNYPTPSYTIRWYLNGNLVSTGALFYPNTGILGAQQVMAEVTSENGCVGIDSFNYTVYGLPGATITANSGGPFCAGQNHVLTGSSTSGGIVQSGWNTGWNQSVLTTSAPNIYVYTVVDTNACRSTAVFEIHPLPDFCGYQEGCYELCDTIQSLVWYAPVGYAAYQWYHNGQPIVGSTFDTLNVPLYQPGDYQVEVTSFMGCTALSPVSSLSFISCGGCDWNIQDTAYCQGVDHATGAVVYVVSLEIINNLGPNANFQVYAQSGTGISNLTGIPLAPGTNTVSFNYTDFSGQGFECFTLVLWNGQERCDTLICIKLPNCEKNCDSESEIKDIDCAGYDNQGNPIYSVCASINWTGSNGSTLSIHSPNGTVSPNSFTVNNGGQLVCFSYTNTPVTTSFSTFIFSYVDAQSGYICRDTVRISHKPCPDSCLFDVFGTCATCKKNDNGVFTYGIELTINNTLGNNAAVSVLPTSAGVFSGIMPLAVGPGIQVVTLQFTDILPRDTILCFRVILTTSDGNICWQDICIYLPPCDNLSERTMQLAKETITFKVAPNPASAAFKLFYNVPNTGALSFEIRDLTGRVLQAQSLENQNGSQEVSTENLSAGTYFVCLKSGHQLKKQQKIIIIK